MSTIINHFPPGDGPGTPDLPSPERRAEISAFVDWLYALYGPDRKTWPPPAAWPWPSWDGAR